MNADISPGRVARALLNLDPERTPQRVVSARDLADAAGLIAALADRVNELEDESRLWRSVSTATVEDHDGRRMLGLVDGVARVVRWCKTSHVPLYGWNLADQGPEDMDLCEPTLIRAFPAVPENEES